jgi:hypothetical protein
MDMLDLEPAEPTGIPADDIDLTFPAGLDPAVGMAILDDESILLDPVTGASHLLDRSATLVLRCLDGVSTLGEIAADIADALGVDRATVEQDVLTLMRTLGEQGLLNGVRRPAPARNASEVPGGVPIGSDLADWDGWEAVPARPTLVVNWGTHCGFCSSIVATLAEVSPRLEAQGMGLLLVTNGTADDLRRQLGDAELPAIHVASLPYFFNGLGTPVAYYVAADRRTLEPLAYGSGEVPELALRLA